MPDSHRFTTEKRKLGREGELQWGGDTGWSGELTESTGVTIENGSVRPATGPAGPTDGLVAHWTFDTDGTDRAGSHDAVLQNGATITSNSQVGDGALGLAGTDEYAVASNSTTLDEYAAFTVAVWVYRDANDGKRFIVGKAADQDAGYILDTSSADAYRFRVGTGTGYNGITATTSTPGEWDHLAVTYTASSGGADLFVNGSHATSGSLGTLESDTQNLGLGAHLNTPGNHVWNGRLDDPRIYDRVLTDQEITDLYTATQ